MVDVSQTKKITLPLARRRKGLKKSHISLFEWGIIIGALALIDLIELILGLFVIGEGVNTFIDFMVGPALAFYLWFRGEDLSSSKRIISLLGSFLLELIPLINDLPLWTLDGLYLMSLSRIQNREAEREERKESKEFKQTQEKVKQLSAYEVRGRIDTLQEAKAQQEEEKRLA